jgi:carbamoyl-phosphate synthase large subunit
MPRRDDIHTILLVGSGPIVIGQACEFDYSGTQGAKSLRQEGYRVVLVNSNPATVMTDPEFADRTYVEPLTVEVLEQVIAKERPDALLPTLGGQTALNLALQLAKRGVLEKYGVELIGANVDAIRKAEDRELFKEAMARIGLECPRAFVAKTLQEAHKAVDQLGYPVILRPSFTLGGTGGGIARNREQFEVAIQWAFSQSPTHECLIEESLLGWKEFELEVIRDKADNFSVICTIENLDPMGVHTGDSVTVAPAMTLTDKEYQRMRDAARAIMTEIGVQTGGSNVQFGVDPATGRLVVIEMNPRVSRSSALASKATGYPIAKIAAKLAVGYTLDELKNDITGTSAAFEPTIDYVVCKVPRFAFEKFAGADIRLTTQMKSVGEVMGIGRTFQQALQKALRSLEVGRPGLVSLLDSVDYVQLAARMRALQEADPSSSNLASIPVVRGAPQNTSTQALLDAVLEVIETPLAERLWYVGDAFRLGATLEQVHGATYIDPWFLDQIRRLVMHESACAARASKKDDGLHAESLRALKERGFSDLHIAQCTGRSQEEVRAKRQSWRIGPSYSRVDTCAAEFEARTPYLYSNWGRSTESEPTTRKKIMILGGGPNRIGQGIEFDYCCVHAAFALKELGFETIMVNCNPETVSTDFDTADRLYFEPLTLEDVLAIVDEEKPYGVLVQYGGQTPLKLAVPLAKAGVRIIGTSAEAIDRAEDREKFDVVLDKLALKRPRGAIARNAHEAYAIAEKIGFPVVVRPSYVLGGRAMEVVHSREELQRYIQVALAALDESSESSARTILVDEFLADAIEVDVDCVCDGKLAVIGGVLQHIEEAGVHSGDSAMMLPPHTLSDDVLRAIKDSARALALELGVVGLLNVQFAVRDDEVYVIEANPRASRTVPFVSKALGVPLAKIAAKVMAGATLSELGFTEEVNAPYFAAKESVFPFVKFPGVDTILGPEMRSTGEVMGLAKTYPVAYGKALAGAGMQLPEAGRVFISVRDADKPAACRVARRFADLGFVISATGGTAAAIRASGVDVEVTNKVAEGHPHIIDHLIEGAIQLVVNTTSGAKAIADSYSLRRQTLLSGIPYFTTMAAAEAVVGTLEAQRVSLPEVCSLQEYTQSVAAMRQTGSVR